MKILWWVILIVLGHFTLIYIFEKIFLNILKIFKNNNLVLNLKYLILSNDHLDKKKKENFLILDRNLKNSFNNEIFYYGNNFLYNLEQKKKINKIKKTYKNNLNYKNLKLKYKLIDFNKKNKSRQNLNNQERQFDIFEMFRNDISSNKKNYFINKKKSINNNSYIINNKKQLINLNLLLKQKNKNFRNSLFLSNKTYNFNTLNFNWNKLNLFSINSKLKLSNSNNDEIMENLKIFLLYNFSYKYYSNLNLNYNYNTSKIFQKKNFEQIYSPKMHFNKIKNTKTKIKSNKKKLRWTTLSLFNNKYETKFINKLNIGQRINLWSLLQKKSIKKKSLYNKKKKEIILWIKNKYNLFNKIQKSSNKKFRWITTLFHTVNDNKKKIKWTKFNFLKIAKNKFIFSNIISKKKKFRWTTNLFNTVNNDDKKIRWTKFNFLKIAKNKFIFTNIISKKKKFRWATNLFNTVNDGNKKIKWTKFNFINMTKIKKKKLNWTTNLLNIVKGKSKKKKVNWTKFNFINMSKIKKKKLNWTTKLLNIVKSKSKKNRIKWTTNLFSIINPNKKKNISLLNKNKIKWTKFYFFKILKNKLSLCNITSLKKKVKWLNFDLFNTNNIKKKNNNWTKFHFFKITKIRGEYNWSNIMSLNIKLKKFLKHKTIYYINTTRIKKINQSILPYQYCYNEYFLDKKLNKKYENFKDFKNDLSIPNKVVNNNPLISFHSNIEYDKNDLLEYYHKANSLNFNKFSNIIIKNYNYNKNKVNVFNEINYNYDENFKNIKKIKYNSFNNKKYNLKKKKKNYFKYLNKNNNKKINFNDQLYTSEYLESIIKKPIIIPENNLNFLNWFFKFNFNSFIDGFSFYLYLYYYKIQIIFFNFLKIFIIPNKIYSYFIFKIKKLYNYIIKNINETKSFYIYLNQYFTNLEIKYLNTIINFLNYFIKIYYFIILKYIITPFFLLINFFEKLQFIYQDFLIKNLDFYYIDLIIIYLKTFL